MVGRLAKAKRLHLLPLGVDRLVRNSIVVYLEVMRSPIQQPSVPMETEAERSARLAEEMKLLEEAEAEAEREGVIPSAEVHAWLKSLDTDAPLPLPKPRRP
jgi:hypothetical protein